MAQRIMNDLTRGKRHGLEMEYIGICMDALELSAGAEEVFSKSQIRTMKDLLDYIDSGRSVGDLSGIDQETEDEILGTLSIMGFAN